MHYFLDFLAKDRSWNDYVKVNQYLILEKYFWIVVNVTQSELSKKGKGHNLTIPYEFYSRLTNFSSTIRNLIHFLDQFVNKYGNLNREDMDYFLTVDKDSEYYDEDRMNRIRNLIFDNQKVSEEDQRIVIGCTDSMRSTYSSMLSKLDEDIEYLDEMTRKDSENPFSKLLLLWVWSECRYFFESSILEFQRKREITDGRDTTNNIRGESRGIRFPIIYVDEINGNEILSMIQPVSEYTVRVLVNTMRMRYKKTEEIIDSRDGDNYLLI